MKVTVFIMLIQNSHIIIHTFYMTALVLDNIT